MLYVLAAEALGYLLNSRVILGDIRGIPLLGPEGGQLVNVHFDDDSFLTINEDHQSWQNAMDCLDVFCVASGSSIQWAGQN